MSLTGSDTSLRYFNVVGSGYEDLYDASPHNLFPLVFRAIEAGVPLANGVDYPTPDGSCIRDYIHVGDLADAHVLAAARLEEAGRWRRPTTSAPGPRVAGGPRRGRAGAGWRSTGLAPRRPGDPARIIADGSSPRATSDGRPSTTSTTWSPAWAAWRARGA